MQQKILAELRAKGVSELAIEEIEKWGKDFERRRELNRKSQHNYRTRKADIRLTEQPIENTQHSKADISLTPALILTKVSSTTDSLLETVLVAPAKRERKKPKTELPPDWQPKGSQRDPTEADEFRSHALAKDWRYANWQQAYVNFQNSPYNRRGPLVSAQQRAGPEETVAQRRERIEAKRLQILREAGNGEGEETGTRQGAGMGLNGAGHPPQLRLAGGISHGEQYQTGDPLFATSRQNRRG
jgi:hypothetical protein